MTTPDWAPYIARNLGSPERRLWRFEPLEWRVRAVPLLRSYRVPALPDWCYWSLPRWTR